MNFFNFIQKAIAQTTTAPHDFSDTPAANLSDYLSDVLDWAIPILGSVALLMMIWAGYIYMTSQGNPDKVNFAKEIIISVLLGILLLFGIGLIVRQIGLS